MPRPNDGTVQETKTFSNLNLNIYASSLLFVDVIAHGPFPVRHGREIFFRTNLSINQPNFCVHRVKNLRNRVVKSFLSRCMPDTVACIDGTYPTQIVVPLGAKNIPAKVFTFFYSLQIVIYHLRQRFTTQCVTFTSISRFPFGCINRAATLLLMMPFLIKYKCH